MKMSIEDRKPPQGVLPLSQGRMQYQRSQSLNHGNPRPSHDRKPSLNNNSMISNKGTQSVTGTSLTSPAPKSYGQVVKREPMSPPPSPRRYEHYEGYGIISIQPQPQRKSSFMSIKEEPELFGTFDKITPSTSTGQRQQVRSIKQESGTETETRPFKNGFEPTTSSTIKTEPSCSSTTTQKTKNTQIRSGPSKTVKSQQSPPQSQISDRNSGFQNTCRPTSAPSSPARAPPTPTLQRRSTLPGTGTNQPGPSSRKRTHSEDSSSVPPPRRTKLTTPEPLPEYMLKRYASKSSENHTEGENKRRQERKRKYQERVGYEPRYRHRHPHQARRAEVLQCYQEGREYEDSDSEEYHYD